MNKFCFCTICIALAIVGMLFLLPSQPSDYYDKSDFLRIHIRANSNSSVDQNVKYLVKNQVVELMNEFLADSQTKEQAIDNIQKNLDAICDCADNVLQQNGFDYGCKASVRQELFPDRQYDDLVLPSGVYDALILELGSGAGDNWWCVVYPPLCFVNSTSTSSQQIIYRSKLVEIINKFFNR